MRVVLTGGGTGGHLFPGLALAGAFRALDGETEILFIGARNGLDAQLVPAHGYPLETLPVGRGAPVSFRRPLNLPRFVGGWMRSLTLLRRFRPDAVVALGGYAAAAPGLAAQFLGLPLVLLEQNAIPGRTNRVLSRWARQVHLQFDEARPHFVASPASILHSGSPLRPALAALAAEAPCNGDALLIVGGSQGAQGLNRLVLDAAETIQRECGAPVLHLAGAGNEDAVRQGYAERGLEADVRGFADDMVACYRRARVVVSRAGAGSLHELAAAGLPAILVPLPTAKDDHQRANATILSDSGAAVVVEQEGTDGADLAGVVSSFWKDEARRRSLATAIRSFARPDAAETIARAIRSFTETDGETA